MTPSAQRIAEACRDAIRIPLTQGFSAFVDVADYDRVRLLKWRVKRNGRTNYAVSDTGGKRAYMHRVVLGVDTLVDHIDSDGLNNRRSNLRVLDSKSNIRRKRPNARGTSRFKGVSRFRERWQSTIKVNDRSIWLGSFFTEEMAARAYDDAAKHYFGEHAFLNFP
jgi:hypothetical protein